MARLSTYSVVVYRAFQVQGESECSVWAAQEFEEALSHIRVVVGNVQSARPW
jgi:hypothetical protein